MFGENDSEPVAMAPWEVAMTPRFPRYCWPCKADYCIARVIYEKTYLAVYYRWRYKPGFCFFPDINKNK